MFFICLNLGAFGQAAKDSSATNKSLPKKQGETEKEVVLDTDESLQYVGSKLLFQVRKRLNLVSKEEEEEELKKSKQKVKLSFGGFTIEK